MMHLVLLMLFAFAKYQGIMSAICKDGWTYYQKDESCLQESIFPAPWIVSRTYCKEDNGEIIEFHTKHKQNFAADLRKDKRWKIPTGISDLDQDGTFEYINGTKLIEHADSLGKNWQSLDSPPAQKECVFIDSLRNGLRHQHCSTVLYPFCEIRLNPGPTTVVGSPPCKPSTWARIGQKFLYFHRELADFATASKHCSAYGGQLLRPLTKEETQSIKERDSLWKPGAWFFWIGVKEKKQHVWVWESGEPLPLGESWRWAYQIRFPSTPLCGAVVWAHSGDWLRIVCKSLNFFTCEASSPCGTTIFMALNGNKELENNTVIDSQYNTSVVIECFQEGTGPDTQISIKCTSVPVKMEGSRRVNLSLPKKYRKSGTNCTCTFVYEDGTIEAFGIKFKGFKYDDDDAKGRFSWLFLLLAILLVLLLVGGLIVIGGKKQNEDEGGDNDEAEKNKGQANNDEAVENKGHEDARSNVTKSFVMESTEGGTTESVEVTESEV